MTRPIELFQDADQYITVAMNVDLVTATEIEYIVDCSTQISKTLTAGQIDSVTTTSFRVAIDAADTTNISVGEYKHQARATIGGKKYNIKFTPNKIKILDSVFVDSNVVGDY